MHIETSMCAAPHSSTLAEPAPPLPRFVSSRALGSSRVFGPLICAAVLSACNSSNAPYTIASAGPLQLAQGRNTQLGIALAVKEINDAGGIRGHRLEVRQADDEADGRKAAQVARQFVDDASVSAVVGHATSGAMVAAAKVYDGHLSAIATSASSPDLTGISRWTFRVISSDSVNGVEMARFASRLGRRRAVILYENDNYGRGLADAFRRGFAGEIVSFDPIAANAPNAELFISYVKLRQPDIVFVAGLATSGVALLTEARRQGIKADFMGGDGWTSLTEHADVAEGVYVGAPFTPSDPRPAAQKFVAAFRAANRGADPDGNAALGYDATKVIAAALAAVGPDRARIRDWLAGFEQPMDGVTGPIRFLRSGDPAGKGITIARVRRDGTLAVAGGGQ
jgi:branched-chain amino acid transport system substrate-binding protein